MPIVRWQVWVIKSLIVIGLLGAGVYITGPQHGWLVNFLLMLIITFLALFVAAFPVEYRDQNGVATPEQRE